MKNIQALEDLNFCVSPYYWDNNNPSALVRYDNGNGVLKNSGYENELIPTATNTNIESNNFESFIFDFLSEIISFRNFIEDGRKFECVNITNDNNDTYFDLLKQLYGSIMYLVFESRILNKDSIKKKRNRYVAFFTEYDVCILNSDLYLNNDTYFFNIDKRDSENEIPFLQGNLSSVIGEKLYRNGFRKSIYNISLTPTKEQFYSIRNKERLNSYEMSLLLWRFVVRGKNNFEKRIELAKLIHSSNIIGFGWLPCLFAKDHMNEMDYCILHALEQCEVLNEVNLSKNLSDNSSPFKPGTMKLVSFTEWGKQEPMLIPFQNIIRIDCDRKPFSEISSFKIFTTDGAVYNCYSFNEIDDKPNVKILKNPGNYNAIAILSYPSGFQQTTTISEDYFITANLNSEKDLVNYIKKSSRDKYVTL